MGPSHIPLRNSAIDFFIKRNGFNLLFPVDHIYLLNITPTNANLHHHGRILEATETITTKAAGNITAGAITTQLSWYSAFIDIWGRKTTEQITKDGQRQYKAQSTLMRFQNHPLYLGENIAKYFLSTEVFSNRFYVFTQKRSETMKTTDYKILPRFLQHCFQTFPCFPVYSKSI